MHTPGDSGAFGKRTIRQEDTAALPENPDMAAYGAAVEEDDDLLKDIPQRRRDSISNTQKIAMQQGFPVRDDATLSLPRQMNRPSEPVSVPQQLRQNKIPVRGNAATGRTIPVMGREQNPQPKENHSIIPHTETLENAAAKEPEALSAVPLLTRSPERNRQIQNGMPVRTAAKKSVDADPDILTNSADSSTESDTTAAGMEDAPLLAVLRRFLSRNNLRIILAAAGLGIVLAVCLCLPGILAKEAEVLPDYTMSAAYESSITPTGGTPSGNPAGEEKPKFIVTLDFYNRKDITVSTSAITLEALLSSIDYKVRESDAFSCDMTTLLSEETVVRVDTVTYGTATSTQSLPYTSQEIKVDTIPRGTKQYSQYGEKGVKTITYTTKLINGVETERWVASEAVTKQPIKEIYYLGVGGTLVGNDGKTYTYSYCRTVNATYYDIEGPTYLGYNADETVVAVDMNYIPLGTKLYVKNDQFDFGVRTAADTGSMIKEWEVDIWIGDDNPQKAAFAYIGYCYDMKIYYLD